MGNQITDNAAADMELDEINYHMMDGPWKGPNDISASPEPRPSEQALSERHDDVSSLEPKLCHCDKWLAGGSDELKYRCVKVEGTVKNPVNVCTENYGGKVNQCPSDSQAQALRERLSSAYGDRLDIDTQVDPELLGGLTLRVGSKLVDASLKTQLSRLEQAMRRSLLS